MMREKKKYADLRRKLTKLISLFFSTLVEINFFCKIKYYINIYRNIQGLPNVLTLLMHPRNELDYGNAYSINLRGSTFDPGVVV